jgi:hypothetical protein
MGLGRKSGGSELDILTYRTYVNHMRTTVRLPDKLMTEAKRFARQWNRTLTDVIEDGVRRVLNENEKSAGPYKLPVLASAGGKCLVDLTRMSDVYDLLDEGLPIEKLR